MYDTHSRSRAVSSIVLQLCTDYADLAPGENGAAASSHVETNLFESLMFIVRNYQGDDEDPGERPNLFQEIVSNTVNLIIIIYLNIYSYRNKIVPKIQ